MDIPGREESSVWRQITLGYGRYERRKRKFCINLLSQINFQEIVTIHRAGKEGERYRNGSSTATLYSGEMLCAIIGTRHLIRKHHTYIMNFE